MVVHYQLAAIIIGIASVASIQGTVARATLSLRPSPTFRVDVTPSQIAEGTNAKAKPKSPPDDQIQASRDSGSTSSHLGSR